MPTPTPGLLPYCSPSGTGGHLRDRVLLAAIWHHVVVLSIMTDHDRDDLLTRAQAADLLGMSVWGVGYYRRMRKLPVVRYRGRIFIPRAAALAFKAEREQIQAVS